MSREIGSLTLYSVEDLHQQLGISKMTIRAYLRDGKITGRKLGVKWYVTESALKAYFEGGASNDEKPSDEATYHYVVKGTNDLVSEQEQCKTIEETVDCIEEQAIISLFQVAVVENEPGHIVELIKASDFLERHKK